MVTLKTQLEYYLNLLGWNPSQLAKRAGVAKTTVFGWMTGSKSIQNVSALKRIADLLSEHVPGDPITVDHLLFGSPRERREHSSFEPFGSVDQEGWLSGQFEIKLRPLRGGRK